MAYPVLHSLDNSVLGRQLKAYPTLAYDQEVHVAVQGARAGLRCPARDLGWDPRSWVSEGLEASAQGTAQEQRAPWHLLPEMTSFRRGSASACTTHGARPERGTLFGARYEGGICARRSR